MFASNRISLIWAYVRACERARVCACVCMCLCVYIADSSNLEIFLEMLNDQEIIVVVSHDEASTKYVLSSYINKKIIL